MTLLLHSLCFVHVLFWVIVLIVPLFAPLMWVTFIIFGVIPVTILLHALFPFHVLNEAKRFCVQDESEIPTVMAQYEDWGVVRHFTTIQRYFAERSFQSPLSPQGMLLISMFICSLRIYYAK